VKSLLQRSAHPESQDADVRALIVTGLSKRFGAKIALSDVGFGVQPREIVGLIGPNGAGKSTIVNILTGAMRSDNGSALFGGRDLLGMAAPAISRAGVARTFQMLRLHLTMTAAENAMLPALVRGHSVAQAREQALGALAAVDLRDRAEVLASRLSTGQRKRLEFARAIASGGSLYLLDEITQGVDVATCERLAELVLSMRDEQGCSVLIIDHDMAILRRVCDRLIALDLGCVIAEGTPAEVLRHPAVVSSYIDV
jgi:branched-chain amino acid transport system ATP-binding protein